MKKSTCERCGSHNMGRARVLQSGRTVCARCHLELPFIAGLNLVKDDLRTDVPARRKITVNWKEE